MKVILVDLDGTLVTYDKWVAQDHLGDPIMPMIERVKNWLAEGATVRIFTARASHPTTDHVLLNTIVHAMLARFGIPPLEITAIKSYDADEIWDDKTTQVVTNTGQPAVKVYNDTFENKPDIPDGIFRHVVTQNLYRVIDAHWDAEYDCWRFVYKRIDNPQLFSRSVDNFYQRFNYAYSEE